MVKTVALTKKFGQFVALDSLDLELHKGQILGYIGPNGAGKTTTIKILVGLSRPTSGEACVAGVDCTRDARRIKQLVGFMPDTFGAYENMRVREYLDFFGAAFKIPRKQRGPRIDQVMELTGSTYMRDLYVDSLSHGMKQRVGVARTLMHDPPLLILDEPANGLDPNARIEMRQLLLRLAEMGKTIIVTSHILPELSRICDTVAIITEGKLRAFGSLDRIMRQISQRRVFEVQTATADEVPRLAELLAQNLDAEAELTPSPQEAEVRFTTAEADDAKVADLLKLAGSQGVTVTQYREVMLDLEDAFMQVTAENRPAS
jgi:ABC-2 type transport system ATP-binding protein